MNWYRYCEYTIYTKIKVYSICVIRIAYDHQFYGGVVLQASTLLVCTIFIYLMPLHGLLRVTDRVTVYNSY